MSTIEIPGYKIVRTLGVGGQATVYLAIQKGFDREVALKVMSPALAADPSFGERFLREAKIVAKLSHKSIVTVYDVGESGSFYYLAMEYLPGGDLKKRISEGMKARESLSIISTIANALHFAHEKGYIHRDVKSENILFDGNGEALLTDFGIAKASNSSTQMTQTGKLIGTPEYMSPEQCRGKELDGRSDLYSLGIIFYEMLTKGVPFTGEDSVAVCIKHVTKPIPELPIRLKHFQWLITLLLAKDPADRIQTGEELAKSVNEFKRSGKTHSGNKQAKRPSVANQQKTPAKKKPQATDEELDAFDDLHTDRRPFEQEKAKSKLPLIVSILLLGVAGVGAFITQDKWLPNAKSLIAGDSHSVSPVSNNQSASNNKTENPLKRSEDSVAKTRSGESNSENNKTDITKTDTSSLINQADALVKKEPHELSDMRQALQLVATVKTLDGQNNQADSTYTNILNTSLAEAVKLAEANLFVESKKWLQLVEFENSKHPLLVATQSRIQELESIFMANASEKAEALNKVANLLASAEAALKANRLSSPPNDNAIALYNQVLEVEPQNQDALEGLQKVALAYQPLIETAVKEESFARAKAMLTRLNDLSEDEALKDVLRQKIAKAELATNEREAAKIKQAKIAAAKKQAEKARQEKLNDPLVQMRLSSSLDSAQSLESQMILVEPPLNNALEKYKIVLEIDDRNESAISGLERIEKLILQKLTENIANANKAEAKVWLEKLRLFNADHPQLNSFSQSIGDIIEVEPILPAAENLENINSIDEKNNDNLDAIKTDSEQGDVKQVGAKEEVIDEGSQQLAKPIDAQKNEKNEEIVVAKDKGEAAEQNGAEQNDLKPIDLEQAKQGTDETKAKDSEKADKDSDSKQEKNDLDTPPSMNGI